VTDKARSAREVLVDHLRLRRMGEFDRDLAENYHPDVVVMSARGVYHGYDGVRDSAHLLWRAVPDPTDYVYDSILVDDRMAILEWRARSEELQVTCGVDSYLIEDGMITAQTIHYRAESIELSVSSTTLTAPGETGPSSDGHPDNAPQRVTLSEVEEAMAQA
jgi:hypothetical protein